MNGWMANVLLASLLYWKLLCCARGADTTQRGLFLRSGVLTEFQMFWEVSDTEITIEHGIRL